MKSIMKTIMKHNKPSKAKDFFKEKMTFSTGPVELDRMIKENSDEINVIDVRESEDYLKGHIPGSINLPKEKWSEMTSLKKDRINILYCYSHVCHLAAAAALEFSDDGFRVMELDGGFDYWTSYKFDVER